MTSRKWPGSSASSTWSKAACARSETGFGYFSHPCLPSPRNNAFENREFEMPQRDLTETEARKATRAASRRIRELFEKVENRSGPSRTRTIYSLISEVRLVSETWRNETKLSKLLLRKRLNLLAGRNFKAKRSPEFMLLRSAILNRQVYSAWAKAANLLRKNRVPPERTAKWIDEHGGIDTIIRKGVGAKK